MSEAVCLVSVYPSAGEEVGVDLVLPARVPLSGLLPDIVALSAAHGDPPGTPWQLSRIDGPALDDRMSLADQDVRDGDLLVLRPVQAAPPRFARTDWTSRIIAAAPDRDIAGPMRTAAGLTAAVVGALLCATVHPVVDKPIATAIVAVLLCGAALIAVIASRAGSAAAPPLSVVTVALAAVCGATVVPGTLSTAHALLAAAAASLTSLALLRFRIGGGAALTALTCGSALLTVAAATAAATGIPAAAAGAVLTLAALFILAGSPRLSILFAGLGPTAVDPDPTDDECHRAAAGHRILAGLVVGASTAAALGTLAGAAGTLHRSGPWAASAGFCAAVGVVLLLRSRTFASERCRWSLVVNGTACLTACSVTIVSSLPHLAQGVGALWVAAGVAAITGGGSGHSPVAARAVDILEYVTIAAVTPLACAVLELFGLVRQLTLT